MKKLIFYFLISSLAWSCKNSPNNANGQNESEVITNDIPSDFLNFYLRFHSDPAFQLEHIIFPLKQSSDGTNWEKEDWVIHQAFNDLGGEYKQELRNFNGIIIELINDQHGYLNLERRFVKTGNEYKLIYYTSTNLFEQNEEWVPEN